MTAPTSGPKWWTKRWVQLVAVGLLGLGIGGAGSSGSASDAEKRATAAEGKVADAEKRAETAEAAAATAKADAEKQVQAQLDALAKQKAGLDARAAKLGVAEASAKANTFSGDGTYLVGSDIRPGTYKAAASPGCYWARPRDLNGGVDSIIDNNNADGVVVVTIKSTDKAFEASGCADFHRI